MAAERPIVSIAIHKDDPRIAVLTLQKEPVNSMNLALWQSLLAAFEQVDADDSIRCIVFQSGLKKNVFTAGLDLQELYAPATSEKRLMEFWGTLSKCLVKIYGSKKLTIAAIAEDGSMGLNEVALGIPVPTYWIMLMKETIGHRETERLLLRALMPRAPELLKIGMVDHVVPLETSLEQTRAKVMAHCIDFAQKNCLNYPEAGFTNTKSSLRKSLQDAWTAGWAEEAAYVWRAISDKKTVASLTAVMQQLQKKDKPKAKL